MSNTYECIICTKIYTSNQGLLNHNKKFHLTVNNLTNTCIRTKDKKCNYCKRLFVNNYTVRRHELKCMYKNEEQIDDQGKVFSFIEF